MASLYARYRDLSLGLKILIFMGIGIIAGLVFGERAAIVKPVGDLFIRLLLMAAIPLVFFNLLAAISNLRDVGLLGRLGIKIFAYYLLTTAAALTLGLAITSWIQPGRGFELSEPVSEELGAVPGVVDVLLEFVPTNIVQAFAEGNVAQIVVFAVLLGVASLMLGDARREPLQKLFGAVAELLRMLVALILRFGPVGIGALAAASVGEYGSKLFGPMALFIGSVWTAQLLMVLLYMLLLTFVGRMSPLTFLKKTGPLYATTAATCSSLASLTVALDVAEKRLKLPEAIYSFTLPPGAQFNKDGTSVMLSAILLFTAQAAGVEFTIASAITILLIGLILSEGSSGIPGGGLVAALIFVQAFQLPLEIAAIVGGIYRLIDMGSTTINCMGDMVGTVLVAKSEGAAAAPIN